MSTIQQERFEIFGKKVQICCRDEKLAGILFPELALYGPPRGEGTDIRVDILAGTESGARLPDEHRHDIQMEGLNADLCFSFGESGLEKVRMKLNRHRSAFRNGLQRWVNMQYTNREERIGQILHEMVLVPMVHFLDDRIPVHSSAVQLGDRVLLIGGTGGVGKTSLELELCMNHGGRFLADDISVVSPAGEVFPNMSYPKIYGYNVRGNEAVRKRIFTGAGGMDRLHWRLHSLRGPARVRRRISPRRLYGNPVSGGGRLTDYVMLSREKREEVSARSLNPQAAAGRTVDILKAEMEHFHRHLRRTDAGGLRHRALLSPEQIFERWREQLAALFSGIRCEMISVPVDMGHDRFREEVIQRL